MYLLYSPPANQMRQYIYRCLWDPNKFGCTNAINNYTPCLQILTLLLYNARTWRGTIADKKLGVLKMSPLHLPLANLCKTTPVNDMTVLLIDHITKRDRTMKRCQPQTSANLLQFVYYPIWAKRRSTFAT